MGSRSPFSPGSPVDGLARQVQQKFRLWRRSTRLGLRRIPEDLWDAATELAATTTAHQVSRLLGLDYSRLKKRVIAACGPSCPSLPGRTKGNRSKRATSPQPPLSPKRTPVPATLPVPSLSGGLQVEPLGSLSLSTKSDRGTVSLPTDGFIEASMTVSQPWRDSPLLAEIRSPAGCILRLFSPETAQIVQAFLKS